LFGYNRDETQKVLEEVADSFEDVWRERGELADKVEDLEQRLKEFQQREELLSATLLAAERSATDAKDSARREAELIIAEAHQEARFVTRNAQRERERLVSDARRVEGMLRSALELVGDGMPRDPQPLETEPAQEAEPEQSWASEEPEQPAWPAAETDAPSSWRDRMDTAEYARFIPPAQATPEEPAGENGGDENVELPPVDPETGEDAGSPPRGFDWG
jgi:cell division initiation protein